MLLEIIETIEDLFLSFRSGKEQGFTYFFDAYYKPLVYFAFTIIKDKVVAEDIVEDSFVGFWEKRKTIRSAPAIKPYLYRSVHNGCLNILRKQKSHLAYVNHMKNSEEELPVDIMQKIIAAETMHQVYLALQNPPTKYQTIATMIYLEEKAVKEVATELSLPLSTIKGQKKKALQLIREQFPR